MKTSKDQPTSFFRGIFTLCIAFVILFSGCKDDDTALANQAAITSMDPPSPAELVFFESAPTNDRVTITYNYTISNAKGARIWVQPYTDGKISNEFLYTSSSLFSGTGSKTVLISIDDDATSTVKVDQLRIVIKDPDQSQDLFEKFVDVDYTFSN